MSAYVIEAIPLDLLVRRSVEPHEAAKDCSLCDETAVQELTARGLSRSLYLCLVHALAPDA